MTDKVFTPTVEMNEVLKNSGSHNKDGSGCNSRACKSS